MWPVAALALVAALGACRDVEVLSGPQDPSSLCTTADCGTFRGISTQQAIQLVRASSRLSTTMRDASNAQAITTRLASLEQSIATDKLQATRLGLLGAMSLVDRAMANPNRTDKADLAAIRLNLEPLLFRYGLR